MTASDLRDLILRHLARAEAGGPARWRRALGDLKVYALETHPHCNWDVRPTGTAYEMARVEQAADAVRLKHPFVEV